MVHTDPAGTVHHVDHLDDDHLDHLDDDHHGGADDHRRGSTINNYRSAYDDDPHGTAYDRAVEWSRTIAAVEHHLHHPAGVVDDIAGHHVDNDDNSAGERIHRWTDDAAYYCPRNDCPCHGR